MRARFLGGVGLLALLAAGGGPAVAADIAARPCVGPNCPPVAAPAIVPDWAGFYFGVHAGFGWGHKSVEPTEFDFDNSIGPFVPPDASPKGGVFGFQFGHNWQWGPVVGGLEIDFSGANINETQTFFVPGSTDVFSRDVKIDELASARGRLGYLIFPNLLAYGTAGIGWGHERFSVTGTDGVDFETRTTFVNEFGWVAGAGLEWKFFPNWFLRGEWLHYDFGKATHLTDLPHFSLELNDAVNVRTRVDVLRAAISYRFGP